MRQLPLWLIPMLAATLVVAASKPGDADYPTPSPSARHTEKVAAVRAGSYDLVLIGDSITHTLGELGGKYEPLKAVWEKHFAPRHAINLGHNGYRTENILWNLLNGELDFPRSPKVAMILIGTNNGDDRHFARVHTPEEIFAGIKAIVELIRERHPTTKILVLRIFPRGGDSETSVSPPAFNSSAECIETCRRAGELTAQLADGRQVFWLDVNQVFLRPDGTINTDRMWDLLHPSPAGAEAWVQAVEPMLARLMGDQGSLGALPRDADGHKDVVVAEKGGSVYRIVTPDDASPAETYAASELQTYLAAVSGVKLPVVAEGKAGAGPAFYIGKCERVSKTLRAQAAKLGTDGVVIKSVGKDFILLGKDNRGQLYAPYVFLERFCGCRFLAPDCTVTPPRPKLTLPEIEYVYAPPFVYRDELYHDVSDWRFAARLKLNGANIWQCLGQPVPDTQGRFTGVLIWPFVHTAAAIVPGKQYFATHPEYYSLVGGKRICEAISGQLCFTHPDVIEIAKAQVLKWIDQTPNLTAVDVSQNDAWPGKPGSCECETCTAVVNEEGAQHGTILRLVNAVADAVKAKYPDKYVETIAYQYSIGAPKLTRPRDNVIIRLCHHACYFHGMGDEELSKPYRAAIDEWRKIARSVWVWHYGVNFWDYLAPNPNLGPLVDDIRYYAAHGVNGVMLQGNLQGSGSELSEFRQYLVAQLLWDPTQNPTTLRSEFCAGYYGSASGDVMAFLSLMDEFGKESKAHIPMNGWRPQEITPPDFVAKGLVILNRACGRTEDPVLRNRVEKLLVPLWHMQLSWPDQYKLRAEEAPALLARFRKALATNRITFSSEGGPSAGLLAEYDKRYGVKTP